jgi:hypothetical protein
MTSLKRTAAVIVRPEECVMNGSSSDAVWCGELIRYTRAWKADENSAWSGVAASPPFCATTTSPPFLVAGRYSMTHDI